MAWRVPGYEPLSDLGEGSTGVVVGARDGVTGTMVAIKYLTPEVYRSDDFAPRYRHEVAILEQIEHPNVAQVFEFVEENGSAAVVTELITGVSVRQILDSCGALDPRAALYLLKGALTGLGEVHGRGITHRDVKPENLLVNGAGGVKVIDIGIAAPRRRTSGGAGGPAHYVAPELWAGRPPSPASDVYAATVVLIECLLGHAPTAADGRYLGLAADTVAEVVAAVRPTELSDRLRVLVARGLAEQPVNRPTDADAFVAELEPAAFASFGPGWEDDGRAALARQMAAPARATAPAGATPSPAGAPVPPQPRPADTRTSGGRPATPLGDRLAAAAAAAAASTAAASAPATGGTLFGPTPGAAAAGTRLSPTTPSGTPTPGSAPSGGAPTAPAPTTPGTGSWNAFGQPPAATAPSNGGASAFGQPPATPRPATPTGPAADDTPTATFAAISDSTEVIPSIRPPARAVPASAPTSPARPISPAAPPPGIFGPDGFGSDDDDEPGDPHRRRRRAAILMAAGVVLLIGLGTAVALVSGAFTGDSASPTGAPYSHVPVAVPGPTIPVAGSVGSKPGIPRDTQKPDRPSGLHVTSRSQTAVSLDWSPAFDNVKVAGYVLTRDGHQIGTAYGPGYTDASLKPDTSYTYTVAAFDAAGNVSPASPAVAATTLKEPDTHAPSVPTGLHSTGRDVTSIVIEWTPSHDDVGVAGYDVVRDGVVVGSSTKATFTDTGLAPASSHVYQVRAFDASNNASGNSAPVTVATLAAPDTTPPSVPSGVSAQATGETTITVSWNASTDNVGVVKYQLLRNGVVLTEPTGPGYSDSGLTPNTTYTYAVRAVDGAGNVSGLSGSASATTLAPTPTPDPTTPPPTPTVTGLTVSYTPIAAPDCRTTAQATITVSGGDLDVTVNYTVNGTNGSLTQHLSPGQTTVDLGSATDATVNGSASASAGGFSDSTSWTTPSDCLPTSSPDPGNSETQPTSTDPDPSDSDSTVTPAVRPAGRPPVFTLVVDRPVRWSSV